MTYAEYVQAILVTYIVKNCDLQFISYINVVILYTRKAYEVLNI